MAIHSLDSLFHLSLFSNLQIFDNEDAYSYEDLNMIRDFMAGHLLQRVPEE